MLVVGVELVVGDCEMFWLYSCNRCGGRCVPGNSSDLPFNPVNIP